VRATSADSLGHLAKKLSFAKTLSRDKGPCLVTNRKRRPQEMKDKLTVLSQVLLHTQKKDKAVTAVAGGQLRTRAPPMHARAVRARCTCGFAGSPAPLRPLEEALGIEVGVLQPAAECAPRGRQGAQREAGGPAPVPLRASQCPPCTAPRGALQPRGLGPVVSSVPVPFLQAAPPFQAAPTVPI
jgi:hypothetical protein